MWAERGAFEGSRQQGTELFINSPFSDGWKRGL